MRGETPYPSIGTYLKTRVHAQRAPSLAIHNGLATATTRMPPGLSSVPPPTGLVWQKPPWSRSPLYDRDPFRNTGEHIRDRTRAMGNGGADRITMRSSHRGKQGPSTYNLKVREGYCRQKAPLQKHRTKHKPKDWDNKQENDQRTQANTNRDLTPT